MSLYEISSLILELLVVAILIIEFVYDWRLNTHVKALKRRTKRSFDFENLNDGEGR